MNKTELVAAMAKDTNLSKKDVEAVLKSFIDVVTDELKKARRFSWLDSELSKSAQELQERVEILRLVRL